MKVTLYTVQYVIKTEPYNSDVGSTDVTVSTWCSTQNRAWEGMGLILKYITVLSACIHTYTHTCIAGCIHTVYYVLLFILFNIRGPPSGPQHDFRRFSMKWNYQGLTYCVWYCTTKFNAKMIKLLYIQYAQVYIKIYHIVFTGTILYLKSQTYFTV